MSRKSTLLSATAAGAAVAVGLAAFSAPHSAQAAWKPTEGVEIVVGVSPGGSMDRTARTVRDALVKHHLIPETSVVVNKPGGSHAIGFAYTAKQKGNAHFIQIVNSPVITNALLGRNPLSYRDFTPLGVVFAESLAYAVRVDSPITDGKDLLARLRKDPESVSFSVSSGLGTVNYFSAVQLGKMAGVDIKKLKTISFKGAAEGMTATLGGHVDVAVTTPYALIPFVESKQLRFLATVTEERMDGILSTVPTWKELGVDTSFSLWRAVVGPKDLTPDQIAFWENAFKTITSTAEWKRMMETDFLAPMYLTSAQTAARFKEDEERYRDLLVELGVIK